MVLTVPEEFMIEACQRIKEFCARYYVDNTNIDIADLKYKIKTKFDISKNDNQKEQIG